MVCEEEASLNRDYTVTRDGLILISFIGAIPVAGLTPVDAANRVSEELVKQRILARATVRITRVAAENAPVRFRGAVRTAGEISWRDGLRLSDLVKVCDPTVNADTERIEITSADGGKLVTALSANSPLRPGDLVHFPPYTGPRELYVLGGVVRPGSMAWTAGLTLGQALTAVGGIGAAGDPNRIRLDRTSREPLRLAIPEDAAYPLRPLDRIVVEMRPTPVSINLIGDIRRPGSYPLKPGSTLLRAIADAGGIPEGRRATVAVIYRLGTKNNRPIIVDLDRVRRGLQGDVALLAGDRVLITDRVPKLAGSGRVALR